MKIIDMHCDTIMELMNTNNNIYESDNMIDIKKLQKGDYLLQCFAMFVPYVSRDEKNIENYSPFEVCHKMIDRYYQEIEKYPDFIKPAYNYQDIENNINNNKITALLTIEEGGVCLGNIEFLRNFYRLGVRMMTLTWNFKNEIASPNIDYFSFDRNATEKPKFVPNTKEGLTEFGKEVVKEMNKLGMVIDCSHLGDKGFYDVIELSTKPIVCSHSCSRTVCNHVRNMTDDMLLKLKENNGVVGINYCRSFIKEEESEATVKDVVKHINYIKDLIGIDYIGLGSDFDGISNKDIELKDASMMNLLIEELKVQNYTQEEIDKITHKNVLRVFKENFK